MNPARRHGGGDPLHVALLGSRGIPNRYGGYETLFEELATRLVERGWAVTVYGRAHAVPAGLEEHRGVRLRVLPTFASKHLDTPVHTLLSALDAALDRGAPYDAALVVNSANALFVPILRSAGIPTALHVDGIEKRRAKWGRFGRAVYAASERLACVVADRLVTDAEVIRRHYEERYGVASDPIAYGVEPRPIAADDEVDGGPSVLSRLGLEPRRYLLYVSRFEPENNPHRVVAAYGLLTAARRDAMPLVMVGAAPYSGRFIAGFRTAADRRVVFPGAIYGDGYRQLLSHAFAYVHATEVGGTHPALVEAMGYGNALVVNDAAENREVAGETALWFRAAEPATLAAAVERLLAAPAAELERRRAAAAERAARLYTWSAVVDLYEALFRRLAAPRHDLE